MTQTRDGKRIVFECDNCHETDETEDGEDFYATWNRMKEAGWSALKVETNDGSDWHHFHDDKCLAEWEKKRLKLGQAFR